MTEKVVGESCFSIHPWEDVKPRCTQSSVNLTRPHTNVCHQEVSRINILGGSQGHEDVFLNGGLWSLLEDGEEVEWEWDVFGSLKVAGSRARIWGSVWLSWAEKGTDSAQQAFSTGAGAGLRCEVASGGIGGTMLGAWDT